MAWFSSTKETKVDYGPTAEEHFKKAAQAHHSAEGLEKRRLELYRIAGEALNRAKDACEPGGWLESLRKHGIPERRAQRYMRFASTARSDVTSVEEEVWARINGNVEKSESTLPAMPAAVPAAAPEVAPQGPPAPATPVLDPQPTPAAVSSPPRPRLALAPVPDLPGDSQVEGPVEEQPKDSKRTWVHQDAQLTCRFPRPHVPDSEFLAALKHACLELETAPTYPRLAA